ncbi:hypothetical protein F3Y22_tig00111008pilonHSYRG00204 [Hibiscus syriacus]|uniref:Uncharacterized protein n=1 Tax=Hibiscus syriacus TaxID=106335 RepID=A0A6A2Z7X4_HIBSY|nr:hypothetical protein F3Y22_tig00111008pilonHSYRG00204 [Hibiscus syriacus]
MTMTTEKLEWVREAMIDDYVVVELLGMSQPRSRPMLMLCDAKIDGDDFNVSSRGSPTTPLSWSGGGGGAASLSAADGFEDTCSSHIRGSPPAAPSRSKRTTADETTSTMCLSLFQLIQLEIASIRATCKQHRASNVNLKRFKMWSSTVDEEEKIGSCVHYNTWTLPLHAVDEREPVLSEEESLFLFPDLTLMPCEDGEKWQSVVFPSSLLVLRINGGSLWVPPLCKLLGTNFPNPSPNTWA